MNKETISQILLQLGVTITIALIIRSIAKVITYLINNPPPTFRL